MIVYRYLSEQHALLALQQRKWKVGKLKELNDPLDCQLILNEKDQPPREMYEDSDEFFNSIYEQYGILCFSSEISDPVIWSHYSDSHRGIVLGFEVGEENTYFKIGNSTYGDVYKVSYSDQRASAQIESIEDQRALLDDLSAQEVLIARSFTVKAKSWAYEKELRHFVRLSDCKMEGGNYFQDLPIGRLASVVLGQRCRVTGFDIHNILRQITSLEQPYSVKVFRAESDPYTYVLNIRLLPRIPS